MLHLTKYKDLGGIGSHIDRHHLPANVERSKVSFNEALSGQSGIDLEEAVAQRIAAGYTQNVPSAKTR